MTGTVLPCQQDQALEIEVVDQTGAPFPFLAFQVEFSDGSILPGKLDKDGLGSVIPPAAGSAVVTFPDCDPAWFQPTIPPQAPAPKPVEAPI